MKFLRNLKATVVGHMYATRRNMKRVAPILKIVANLTNLTTNESTLPNIIENEEMSKYENIIRQPTPPHTNIIEPDQISGNITPKLIVELQIKEHYSNSIRKKS